MVAAALVALNLLFSFCEGGSTALQNPHYRPSPLSRVLTGKIRDARPNLRGEGVPTLSVSTTLVRGEGDNVTVTWSGVKYAAAGDWIGIWPEGTNLRLFSAPIKFMYTSGQPNPDCQTFKKEDTCSSQQGCQWVSFDGGFCGTPKPPTEGSITFQILNMRTNMVFNYISGNAQYPELVAQAELVRIADFNIPLNGHLALGSDHTKMRVYWQAGGKMQAPGVAFGTQSGKYPYFAKGWAAKGRNFTAQDMCDTVTSPAGRQGWMAPPLMLEAELQHLIPETTYYYIYGDQSSGWSEELTFTAAPRPDPSRRTVVAAFGDLGQTEPDGVYHRSWDFNNRGEMPSLNTTQRLAMDKSIELVLHIGDISYAVGYLSQWENFFHQIYPVAARLPWMASIGNHEFGHSTSMVPSQDSGGECGVPFNAYFPFASQDPESKMPFSQKQPWYSFTYGSAVFIQMSTEHDYSVNSDQYKWIEGALKAVNRTMFPWVVVSGHRPMYAAVNYSEDIEEGSKLQTFIEPLLVQYEVNLALWGHWHGYVRYCPMNGGKCMQPSSGQHVVHHYIIGMAGYEHSPCPKENTFFRNRMETCDDTKYGYVRLNFENDTTLMVEYVNNEDGSIFETSFVRRAGAALEAATVV